MLLVVIEVVNAEVRLLPDVRSKLLRSAIEGAEVDKSTLVVRRTELRSDGLADAVV
jgi:hypothetical protein